MLSREHIELRKLTRELRDLNEGQAFPDVRQLCRDQLDSVRPAEDISSADVAEEHRMFRAPGGVKVKFSFAKAPYLREIHDAMDDPTKSVIVVKGPARCGKTSAAENFLLKVGMYGPSRNVLWYMHAEPELRRYMRERGEPLLKDHEELWEKVETVGGRSAWNLKTIDGATWEWLPANDSTTRQRSAALVVGDEIDAMRPEIGDAIVTLIKNRQREVGAFGKAFLCSHPDRGPQFGIDHLLLDTDMRVRIWTCPDCAHLMSPAVEAPAGRRITWNMGDLMKFGDDMPRDELLEYVAEHVFLTCPNCKAKIGNDTRLELDAAGVWMGKGQTIDKHENIVGDRVAIDQAGFIIHAFMAPFVTLGGLAKEYAGAMLHKLTTGSDALLRQVNVKSLGETHRDEDPAAKPKIWAEVKAAHLDPSYVMGEIPEGVDFLTAMSDTHGGSFETGVWGWRRNRECWLIDRFSLKQRMGMRDIRPGENIEDWDVLEYVLGLTYPLNDGSGRHLGIAKMAVDTGGVPGVTENARIWAANLLASGRAPSWRIMLSKGDYDLKGAFYGVTHKILEDKAGRPLPVPVLERVVNVTEVKRMMSARLEILEPGPNYLHLPSDVTDAHVRELCSEVFLNDLWVKIERRNETWDTLIMSEVARALLAPDNVAIDWVHDRPIFAVPFIPKSPDEKDDVNAPQEQDFFSRLSALNRSGKRSDR
jgi:phage terminase large subunit GpA-like protein